MKISGGSSPLGVTAQRLTAVILAAGYSSRMGQFKPLLSVGGCTAAETIVRLFLAAGISDVCVVLGHRADELRPVVEAAGARCVINADYDRGMYSSVCAGVAAMPASAEACFVTPADIPLVRVSTICRLAHCFAETRKEIIYPYFQEHRGHPTLISRTILAEVLEGDADARLSTLLASHEQQACNVFVPDEGIHLDMDTPEDLVRVRELACHREIPSLEECEAILANQTEERVAKHSRVVARVAGQIAAALVDRGSQIEPRLVRAGGLLHDVAKGKPDHATEGARLLRELGFSSVADVVASHTDCTFVEHRLDAAAIIYLADKLVSGARVIGIEQRFQNSLERFQDNPVALSAALRRRATAEAIAQEVESCLGTELPQVISELSAICNRPG
jgi:putative nucleotidyltransferase with HDIG domain